ncbi:MAG: OmpA family protein [Cellvibrionaceae bacterium]|nr:OmpA family protein [Cellvibrionaceae bacterium]
MIKRERVYGEVNHERWLVSYADLVTLLFAFFVVMYSISQVSESKYKQLSTVLEQVFAKVEGENSTRTPQAVPQHLSVLKQVESNILEALADFVNSNDAIVHGTEAWVEIELNANLLFDSGSAVPTPRAQQAFSKMAELLAPLGNEVSVAGHTDNQPIRTEQYANNWQLSSARAIQVVELLVGQGVVPERLSAIGYGEFRPVADNTTEAGRLMNRRVVLRVSKDRPKDSLAAVDRKPAAAAGGARPELPSKVVAPVRLQDGGLLFTSDPPPQEEP